MRVCRHVFSLMSSTEIRFISPGFSVLISGGGGGIEHQENNVDMDSVRLSFDSNLSLARQSSFNYVDIEVLSRRSDEALPWLIHSGYKEKFDFIYVDGSHQAPDVLVDAVLSALLLRKGGVLVLMTIFGEIGCQDMMGFALPPSR